MDKDEDKDFDPVLKTRCKIQWLDIATSIQHNASGAEMEEPDRNEGESLA